jgi:hypothetical protein
MKEEMLGNAAARAENEVRLACKRENPDWDGKSFDYGCSCYQSALKAYKSICGDGHSGFSFNVTKNILIRLMEGLPLTPIEDTEDNWNLSYKDEDGGTVYQCYRMSRLFKRVGKDGGISYSDVGRSYCQEISNPKDTYQGFVDGAVVDEKFPIAMPYYPKAGRYKVVVDTFASEGFEHDNEDYNTRAALYVVTPEGDRVDVNKFFADKDGKFVEITEDEYNERLAARRRSNKWYY